MGFSLARSRQIGGDANMPARQRVSNQFLFSTEEETLTATPESPTQVGAAAETFLSIGRRLVPSLSAASGYFNGYGRVYIDSGHIELAAAECDDPYLLPIVVEKQHRLAARAVSQMAADGQRLVLANNNHSGLLSDGCAVWGAHENHLVEKHPSEFTDLIMPFLVTRIYAGAGGIRFPSGDFVAGVRPLCMKNATGGCTTRDRAIHSTAREEHHVGTSKKLFRYHQILGDGHRSHWNLATQFGATALALKAVVFDPKLRADLQAIGAFPPARDNWVGLLKRLNRLATPGIPLAIDPLVVQTQRVYVESGRRISDAFSERPPWIPRLLTDWSDMLDAMERLDRPWLAARLDAFAKYELYTNVLAAAGASWQTLPARKDLFHSLALLDQNYHEFCNPDSVFCRLENAGLLSHCTGEFTEPGREPDPYIPDTNTRARARALYLRDHANDAGLVMDWSCVHDLERRRWRQLFDPFAQSYGPWQGCNLSLRRLLAQTACSSDEPNLESFDG
jgi:hypothetical protein